MRCRNSILYGDNIEAGIGPDGAFGSNVASPSGKSAGKLLGYISDPSGQKFQHGYHGDFFIPGYQEEGWGIRVNGKNYNNNSTITNPEILGSLSNYRTSPTSKQVAWKGSTEGLEIHQTYRIYNSGMSIIFDITLKNTTSSDMNDVYYMRTVDPDNNAEQQAESEQRLNTTNTILYQGGTSSGGASVSASQADGSLLTLSGYSENSRVSFGGQFNRDPVEVYTGSDLLKHSGTNTADESISIAYKFAQIKAGASVKFRTGYQLANVPRPNIDIDADNSSGASGSYYQQAYSLGTAAVNVTDSDISITGSNFTLLGIAIVSISNPHAGDKLEIVGQLPSGIAIDSNEENTDTQIVISGIASVDDYKNALRQIRFYNEDIAASTNTRALMIQIFDDNYTPSIAAESLIHITAKVILTNDVIAVDNIINQQEQKNLSLAGKSAANAIVRLIFTDENNQTIIRTTLADASGNWSFINNVINISFLSDGIIALSVIATDTNSNQSHLNKSIKKDTTVLLNDIYPSDGESIATSTPTFRGKADTDATISITLSNGKVYSTTADSKGDWEITLDELALGSTLTATIKATDTANNEKTLFQTINILDLPLKVNEIKTDTNGLSLSNSPLFSGTSVVGTSITVTIIIDTNHSETCITTTDTEGKWFCQMTTLHSGGPYNVEVTADDANGNHSTLIQKISIPEIPLVINTPSNNAVISDSKSPFSGTSTAGSTVTVTASTGQTCSSLTNNKGNWSCELPTLPLGKTYTISISSEDEAGNKTQKFLEIKTSKLPLSVVTLGDKNTASSTTPTLIGTSTAGTKITITVSTGASCTTTTNSNGDWLCELSSIPVGGPYDVTIKAEGSNGNITSIKQTIIIPKVSLVIINPVANSTISTSSIIVTGTTDPNTDITLLGPDGQQCTSTSDDDGVWSCTLDNLQKGSSLYISVISGNDSVGRKTILLPIRVANISEKINTVTGIGGGSSAPLLLLFISLISIVRLIKK